MNGSGWVALERPHPPYSALPPPGPPMQGFFRMQCNHPPLPPRFKCNANRWPPNHHHFNHAALNLHPRPPGCCAAPTFSPAPPGLPRPQTSHAGILEDGVAAPLSMHIHFRTHTAPTDSHISPPPKPPRPSPLHLLQGLESFHAGLLEDAIVASGAGGGDVVVGPHEAQVHGQQGTAHVGDGKWYAEGIHLLERLHAHTSMQDCARLLCNMPSRQC